MAPKRKCECGECENCKARVYNKRSHAKYHEARLAKAAIYRRENAEKISAQRKQFREANKERLSAERRAKYDEKARQTNVERSRKWYSENRERVLAEARERYANDPEYRERRAALVRETAERNPDIRRRAQRRYKDRKRGAPVEPEAMEVLPLLWGDPCSYCGGAAGQIDHIVPLARGGDSSAANLTAACGSCNASKNATPLLHFLLRRAHEADAGQRAA